MPVCVIALDDATAPAPLCAAPQLGQNPALSATMAPHFVQCGIAPPRNHAHSREPNKIPRARQEETYLHEPPEIFQLHRSAGVLPPSQSNLIVRVGATIAR